MYFLRFVSLAVVACVAVQMALGSPAPSYVRGSSAQNSNSEFEVLNGGQQKPLFSSNFPSDLRAKLQHMRDAKVAAESKKSESLVRELPAELKELAPAATKPKKVSKKNTKNLKKVLKPHYEHEESKQEDEYNEEEDFESGGVNNKHKKSTKAYGKDKHENLHEAFNKDHDDVEQTPTLFRSSKGSTNYVKDFNKTKKVVQNELDESQHDKSRFANRKKRVNQKSLATGKKSGKGISKDTQESSNFQDEQEDFEFEG